jgi:hypothetical protein
MERLKRDKRRTASSRAWLDRQINDPYVMRAKREGFRSLKSMTNFTCSSRGSASSISARRRAVGAKWQCGGSERAGVCSRSTFST